MRPLIEIMARLRYLQDSIFGSCANQDNSGGVHILHKQKFGIFLNPPSLLIDSLFTEPYLLDYLEPSSLPILFLHRLWKFPRPKTVMSIVSFLSKCTSSDILKILSIIFASETNCGLVENISLATESKIR